MLGFDELDLDDTLKAKKEPETSLPSRKGKRACSPLSMTRKCRKKGVLDSLSDNASESTSVPTEGASTKKESHRAWSESTLEKKLLVGEAGLSDSENSAEESAHKHDHCLSEVQEDAANQSGNYNPQKERDTDIKASTFPAQTNYSGEYKSSTANDCSKNSDVELSTAISAEHTKAVSTPSQLHQEPAICSYLIFSHLFFYWATFIYLSSAATDENIEIERAAHSELDIESSRKPLTGMESDGLSSECEMQQLAVIEEREQSNSRMDANESPPSKYQSSISQADL
ncbi:hypothetical protein L7F22_047140 [Adiantum nelumboides]|nr:hypothetical protein [Adiantum nelumboides]